MISTSPTAGGPVARLPSPAGFGVSARSSVDDAADNCSGVSAPQSRGIPTLYQVLASEMAESGLPETGGDRVSGKLDASGSLLASETGPRRGATANGLASDLAANPVNIGLEPLSWCFRANGFETGGGGVALAGELPAVRSVR